ncbi:MAG: nucleoside hydrolase [Armatimonadetes bacterium]|nr:nucleoside hydrolase [Armatimonadota bacterium]
MTSIIFDTDMGNDVDDALALAVLHSLQSRGACKILAVTLTRVDPWSARFTDAVNTFYGRPEIPIGVKRDGKPGDPSTYLKVAEKFPHRINPDRALDAVDLIRKTLQAQPDGSVAIAQVGFFSNLAKLLDDPKDRDLVLKKVKVLSIMAGAFATVESNNHFCEYNVTQDIPAAQKLAKDWPTSIIWGGFEIGNALRYPVKSIEQDFSYVPTHPIPLAYRAYCQPGEERPCWDLASCLYAAQPDRDFFALSPHGQVTVENDGFTRFTPKNNGRDRFLILDPMRRARVLEALVQLTSQPPQK